MDIASLKLADLKRELRDRGLSSTGSKQVLVDRLLEAMSAEKAANDDSNIDDLLDEDSMLDDEESDVEGAPDDSVAADITISSPVATVPPTSLPTPVKTPESLKRSASSPLKTEQNGNAASQDSGSPPSKKKIILNRQPVPEAAPQILPVATAESIKAASENKPPAPTTDGTEKAVIKIGEGTTAPVTDKLKMRQEKFGSGGTTPTPAPSAPIGSATEHVAEKLKKRAERFGSVGAGITAGKVSLTPEDEVKLAKRKERFGIPTDEKLDELKEKRAARFGGNSSSKPQSSGEVDDKKKLRAARFSAL